VPLAYQFLDKEGRIVEVTPSCLKVLGYSKQEVLGVYFSEFLHPDWKAYFKENFPRFKAAGEVLGVEFEIVKKMVPLSSFHFMGK
jgi:two-component system, cell cycle sensor histidine kinase and response regulator CckA